MGDATVIIVLIFMLIVFVGIGVGIYFFYKWYEKEMGNADPENSINFKPGDTVSFKPSWKAPDFSFNPDFTYVANNTLYTVVAGVEKTTGIILNPNSIECKYTNWLYDTDRSLRLASDPSMYVYGTEYAGSLARTGLELTNSASVGAPLIWDYDRTRNLWKVTSGTLSGQYMRIAPASVGFIDKFGITIDTLPANFNSLDNKDFNKVAFQWTVRRPLTGSTTPVCLAS